jgi:hypothetical protein
VTLQKLAQGFGLDVSEFLSPHWPRRAKKRPVASRKRSTKLSKNRRTS